jgi:hypothetical protein
MAFSASNRLLSSYVCVCLCVHVYIYIFHLVNSNYVVCSSGLLTHSFELEAKAKGLFYAAPAVITFRIPTKAALQVCICNSVQIFLGGGD